MRMTGTAIFLRSSVAGRDYPPRRFAGCLTFRTCHIRELTCHEKERVGASRPLMYSCKGREGREGPLVLDLFKEHALRSSRV